MRKFLQWALAIILIAVATLLIIQAVWYGNLDHQLQLDANGFAKDDITMLTYGQQAGRVFCWIGGVISALAGLFAIGSALDIISLD